MKASISHDPSAVHSAAAGQSATPPNPPLVRGGGRQESSRRTKILHDSSTEVERLHCEGHDRLGQWDLAQVCDHLSFFIRGSLDGHRFKVPWLFKFLFGRKVLKRILSQRRMKPGVFTPQNPLPAPGGDEAAAVSRIIQLLDRLQKHTGEFHDSPFFGHLTPEQWREMHLIHCTHHLAYLQPVTT